MRSKIIFTCVEMLCFFSLIGVLPLTPLLGPPALSRLYPGTPSTPDHLGMPAGLGRYQGLGSADCSVTLHYTTLHYTTQHYTTIHYTTLHYCSATLHYTTRDLIEGLWRP